MLMRTKPQGHLLRSELALISNMARTIRKDEDRSRLMKKYDEILKEIAELPASFGKVEILDENRAKLNTANLRQKFSKDDHLIICIGRTQGSAGNDIGFALADALRINYYDAEIFNEVLRRLDAEKDSVTDVADLGTDLIENKYQGSGRTIKERLKDFDRYHGLTREDAIFFNQSDLICKMAKEEDFISVFLLRHRSNSVCIVLWRSMIWIRRKRYVCLKSWIVNMQDITIIIPVRNGEML